MLPAWNLQQRMGRYSLSYMLKKPELSQTKIPPTEQFLLVFDHKTSENFAMRREIMFIALKKVDTSTNRRRSR